MFALISMKRIIKSSSRLHFYFHICCYFSSSIWYLINLVSSFLLPHRMFRYLFSFSPTLSPLPGFDQEWFPAHWFAAFRGVNCVILRILPWHGSRGRGWWGKRDLNGGGARDKGALLSCEHCFFKSIFSMADGRGHSSGWGGGGVAFETCAMMLSEEARASHAADCQGFATLPPHYSLTQSSYQPITLVHV